MNAYTKNYLVLFTTILSINYIAFPQEMMQIPGGTISGTVIDSASNNPIEYANVILFSSSDKAMANGTVTGRDGRFDLTKVRPGKYFADVQFIGYEKKRIEDISIGRDNWHNDLGKITIKASAITIGAVNVEGERSPVSYQIDKKVVDVSQIQTVASGNAADVLQNVPSITVDADGTVSLRGSTDFTVLVDGRPSVMEAQDVLQQIPASSIKTIEIITNPSAKYNPEGTSGIINILMKKTEDSGLNGISHMNLGLNDKYGGDFLLEYKNSSYSANFGADYNRRFSPGTMKSEESYTIGGNTSNTISSGNSRWGRNFWGLRGGIELLLGEKNILNFSGRYGSRKMIRSTNNNFSEQSQSGTFSFKNSGDMNRGGGFYSLNTNYTHKFGETGHELTAQLTYGYHNGDETTLTESLKSGKIIDGKKTTESGPSRELEGKIEYTLPLGEKRKFEAGYEGQNEISNEVTGLQEFDTLLYAYQILPQFGHDTKNTERQHSLYSLYSNEWNDLGIQLGLRGEYTYRLIELSDVNRSFKIDEWDFFPTFHASYKFKNGHQLMGSYTRRIRRPWGWALEPFLTWTNANNVQQGNPALKNEYVDSYEAGAQTSVGKIFLSVEGYYRITHNKIEQVRSAYADNVTLTTFENTGHDYSLGSEFQMNCELFGIWNLNFMGNAYKYRIEGSLGNVPFSRESFNWNTRINNTLKFSSVTQAQINTTYYSPSVSSQGKREGFFTTDFSIRQDLFNRVMSLTLQIRDLFGTSKQESTSQGTGYYSYNYFKGESPMVMLSIKYIFNNYSKEERHQRSDEGSDEGEGL